MKTTKTVRVFLMLAPIGILLSGAPVAPSAKQAQPNEIKRETRNHNFRGHIMNPNEKTIRDFIAAWSRLDAAELASYFAEDGCYYNMPTRPVCGRQNIEAMIKGFISTWTETRWEIITLLSAGDVVIAERLDKTKTTRGNVDLPCVGVFEMKGGKIKQWRDYFDLGTYQKAMQK